jgi:hypothetical protein
MKILLASALIVFSQIRIDYEKTYNTIDLLGWKVKVSETLWSADSVLAKQTISFLIKKLKDISSVVPEPALSDLKQIPIWIDNNSPHERAMQYHASRRWLSEHGYNPEKEKSVEISHPNKFIAWSADQPWLVLHELSHGYHDNVLGYNDTLVDSAYKNAIRLHLYKHVRRNNGENEDAYALSNAKEYFAELSEAYFGENDFFPFNRKELQAYDSLGYALMKYAWERK